VCPATVIPRRNRNSQTGASPCFARANVFFQFLDQTPDQRGTCGIGGEPDRDFNRIEANVQDVDMGIERSRNVQSRYEGGKVGIAAGCWNKDGLDHLNFPGRMAPRELNQMRSGLEAP
jgi:hypothetical protein